MSSIHERATTRAEVQEFLAGPAAALNFPTEANTDPALAAAYLDSVRSIDFAASRQEDFSVDKISEFDIRPDLRVRVYAKQSPASLPILLYFHGGGWVMGDLDMHEDTCRRLAAYGELCVVSVDYRLAPEYPYPAALHDCFEALQWAFSHAVELGGDPGRIGVAGSSTGGNLAAALAILSRDREGPQVSLQLLLYPCLDPSLDTESYRAYGSGYLLERDQMAWYWQQYVRGDEGKLKDPLVAPSRAEDLSGLPPAIILLPERDPLRDEGLAYAERLRDAGVAVETIVVAEQIHGFLAMPQAFSNARTVVMDIAEKARSKLAA